MSGRTDSAARDRWTTRCLGCGHVEGRPHAEGCPEAYDGRRDEQAGTPDTETLHPPAAEAHPGDSQPHALDRTGSSPVPSPDGLASPVLDARSAASSSLRLAYADPPYPGCAHLYEGHPDYAGEVDHALLVYKLVTEYDGYCLHTSSVALAEVLDRFRIKTNDMPRVMAWVKPFAAFKRNVPVAYAWEPVCNTCHELKPLDGYPGGVRYRDVRPNGVHGTCRSCHTEIKRRYRDQHPEYRRVNGGAQGHRGRNPEAVQASTRAEAS